jgi:hypothetical protein
LEHADFKLKIVVAGNHDACLDSHFTSTRNSIGPDDHHIAASLIQSSQTISYLQHEARVFQLRGDSGAILEIKVFGSPCIPGKGLRPFSYQLDRAEEIWSAIPLDTDIVVTHTPSRNHLDKTPAGGSVGCVKLGKALSRVRPRLHVCGHIHEARGVELVEWASQHAEGTLREERVTIINDKTRGTKKQFKVSLLPSKYQPRSRDKRLQDDDSLLMEQMFKDLAIANDSAPGDTENSISEEKLETCVVNASFLRRGTRSRSSHEGENFNKPIIVEAEFWLDKESG